jgi:hypothetical protein
MGNPSKIIIVLISLFLCLDFPDSFENLGNLKKNLLYIAWILQILCLDFSDLNILGRQFK